MSTTIEKVREVRQRSGVGLNACKQALDVVSGDVEQALVWLQKRGEIKAADAAGRIATEGRIFPYVHGGGSKVAFVEINCETDFALRSDAFLAFGSHVAMHIIASSPKYLDIARVPSEVMDAQLDVFKSQVQDKPEQAREKIVKGKLDKWVSEVCLLNQESAIEPGKTIDQLRVALVAQLGENVTIRRFLHWEVGEGF